MTKFIKFRKLMFSALIAALFAFTMCDSEDSEEAGGLDDESTQLLLLVAAAQTQNNIANSSCRQNVAGCSASQFSCTASPSCYASLALCANSGTCPAGNSLEFLPGFTRTPETDTTGVTPKE